MTRSSADPAPARQRGNAGVPPGSLTPADDERAAFNRPVAAAPSPLTAGAVWLAAGLLLSGVAGAGVYVAIEISHVIDRARPPVADWAATAGGPSFPSIHTTAATLFAASCAWALTARARAGWPRRVIGAGALAYAAAVGLSRVWLGVHWPTDVIGGWLFGAAWSAAAITVIRALRRRSASSQTAAQDQDDGICLRT
ncbi:MAG: phosphatase PAP2 family protein [Streptosporangiaceae bacterium]|jgi:undecaprenyl-diphosphatase